MFKFSKVLQLKRIASEITQNNIVSKVLLIPDPSINQNQIRIYSKGKQSHTNIKTLNSSVNMSQETPFKSNANTSQSKMLQRQWNFTNLGKDYKPNDNDLDISFTVMSYNILAQDLLEEHRYLYTQNDQNCLSWEYRLHQIVKEITEIEPHILCLQEMQQSHLQEMITALKPLNFSYIFKKRTGEYKSDGCIIFYQNDMFRLVDSHTVEYYQPDVEVLDRDNIGIIAKLAVKNDPKSVFIVSTTHLLYNPRRQDIRLAQIQVLLAELHRFSYDGRYSNGNHRHIPIILTGDFNLQPFSAPYKLLCKGMVQYDKLAARTLADTHNRSYWNGPNMLPSDLGITDRCTHIDFHTKRTTHQFQSKLYHSEKAIESKNKGIALDARLNVHNYDELFGSGYLYHHLHLTSVIQLNNNKVASTYQDRWITVDYIFYSKIFNEKFNNVCESNLKLLARLELPTVESCIHMGNIPNAEYGSDHLSLAAKFLFRRRNSHYSNSYV